MKKLTLFAVAAFAVASMTSCKKDRVCTCTTTGSTTQNITTYTKVKKGDAKKACSSLTATVTSTDAAGTVTTYPYATSCTLK